MESWPTRKRSMSVAETAVAQPAAAGQPAAAQSAANPDRSRVDRGGRAFRAPGQPVEPEDGAVYLRPQERHSHHRHPRDGPRPLAGQEVSRPGRGSGEPGAVRRHQEAGRAVGRARVAPLPHAVRRRAAGWVAASRISARSAAGSAAWKRSRRFAAARRLRRIRRRCSRPWPANTARCIAT